MQPSRMVWSSESYKVTVTNVFNKKDDLVTGSATFLLHPASQAVHMIIKPAVIIVFNPVFFMPYILAPGHVKVKAAPSGFGLFHVLIHHSVQNILKCLWRSASHRRAVNLIGSHTQFGG